MLTKNIAAHLATGQMWTYYGRKFDAPTFPLGIEPAEICTRRLAIWDVFSPCYLRAAKAVMGRFYRPKRSKAVQGPVRAAEPKADSDWV